MAVPLLRDARKAGWVNCFRICLSAMPRAQNNAAKGSILKEDEILCQSGYMIYLWLLPSVGNFMKGRVLCWWCQFRAECQFLTMVADKHGVIFCGFNDTVRHALQYLSVNCTVSTWYAVISVILHGVRLGGFMDTAVSDSIRGARLCVISVTT